MQRYLTERLKRILQDKAFVICMICLVLGASGFELCAQILGLHLVKERLELQKPLDELDESRLLPYRVIYKEKIENDDVLTELGTEDYIQWYIEDTENQENDSAHYMTLFITYYTGDPDQVPHIPDICYVGGGSTINQRTERVLTFSPSDTMSEEIPIRILDISAKNSIGENRQKVVYFFRVNGSFECQRNKVRVILNNPFNKYAFFCKIELTFPYGKNMTDEETIAATEKLSQVFLPVLLEEHWPVWPPDSDNKDENQ
ncbi:MAG: exosortase-associated EpsI family protein [Sedimentisphaerales bacterium]|nr:exosortase-associated EpsI family protein [Sedimentisphaerales bacterium]